MQDNRGLFVRNVPREITSVSVWFAPCVTTVLLLHSKNCSSGILINYSNDVFLFLGRPEENV